VREPHALADTQIILDLDYGLWRPDPVSNAALSSAQALPSSIPFSIDIRRIFRDTEIKEQSLPPSHDFQQHPISSACEYSLRILLTKHRTFLGGGTVMWVFSLSSPPRRVVLNNLTYRIKVPFIYTKRRRPSLPIVRAPRFFDAIKSSPSDWYQATTAIPSRTSLQSTGIHCSVNFIYSEHL
jgi:hypothetical protein